jgi:hypothetical protein
LLNFKGHQFSVEEVTAGLDGLLAGGVAQ